MVDHYTEEIRAQLYAFLISENTSNPEQQTAIREVMIPAYIYTLELGMIFDLHRNNPSVLNYEQVHNLFQQNSLESVHTADFEEKKVYISLVNDTPEDRDRINEMIIIFNTLASRLQQNAQTTQDNDLARNVHEAAQLSIFIPQVDPIHMAILAAHLKNQLVGKYGFTIEQEQEILEGIYQKFFTEEAYLEHKKNNRQR